MVAPLVVIGIPVGVALAGLIAAALWLTNNKGKTMVFVGPASSGKSTFVKFLMKGTVGERRDPSQTLGIDDYGSFFEAGIRAKVVRDVGGGQGNHPVWKRALIDAEMVCYVFDASKAIQLTAYRQEIRDDLAFLLAQEPSANEKPPVLERKYFIAATHSDVTGLALGELNKRINSLELVEEMTTRLRAHCQVGNLVSDKNADSLRKRLFR